MHPADILALVKKSRFRTLEAVAQHAKLSPSTVRGAFRRPQRRAEIAISKAVGRKLHDLWPDRWDKNGSRLVNKGKSATRTAVPATHQSERRAA